MNDCEHVVTQKKFDKHEVMSRGEPKLIQAKKKKKDLNEENDETWVRPDAALEIRGPAFIYHPSDPYSLTMAFDATREQMYAGPLGPLY